MKFPIVLTLVALLSFSPFDSVDAQQKGKGKGGKGRPSFSDREAEAVAEAFVGVTTDGKAQEGVFSIQSTGVSTEPIMKAAAAFLDGLTEEQRKITTYPVDDDEWRRWANQHSLVRQGVSFEQMNDAQRGLAFGLIGAGLSADGLKLSQDIMKLNETLGELTGRPEEYGRWLYHMTVMGEPSMTEPWGWQLDGHHCVVNYFVLGDQVVMSPAFFGSEPIKAESGKHEGTEILQTQEEAGLSLVRSLNEAQLAKAVISAEKSGTDSRTEAFHDNEVIPYEGLLVSELDDSQQAAFLDLASVWISQMREGHAKVKLSEIEAHLDETRFAWIGETKEDSVFYYRIHSPVVLIEFDHQRPIALGRDGIPTHNHIHAVIRTPNGNDYGKDLLRQHLEEHHSHE